MNEAILIWYRVHLHWDANWKSSPHMSPVFSEE